jgi:hypothetical protein
VRTNVLLSDPRTPHHDRRGAILQTGPAVCCAGFLRSSRGHNWISLHDAGQTAWRAQALIVCTILQISTTSPFNLRTLHRSPSRAQCLHDLQGFLLSLASQTTALAAGATDAETSPLNKPQWLFTDIDRICGRFALALHNSERLCSAYASDLFRVCLFAPRRRP